VVSQNINRELLVGNLIVEEIEMLGRSLNLDPVAGIGLSEKLNGLGFDDTHPLWMVGVKVPNPSYAASLGIVAPSNVVAVALKAWTVWQVAL
jgi:hypothetical protein